MALESLEFSVLQVDLPHVVAVHFFKLREDKADYEDYTICKL